MKRPLFRICALSLLAVSGLLLGLSSGTPDRQRDRAPGQGGRGACGCAHACTPASYQGCGCGSIGCFPGGERLTGLSSDAASLSALKNLEGPAACVNGLAGGTFPCLGIDLLGYVPLEALRPGATSASNLWAFASLETGREYAVLGLNNGTAVVDVTDPVHPVVVGSVPGPSSLWREVKVYQFWNASEQRHNTYAYVVSEAATAGLQILNLSDLPSEVSLAATYRGFETAHTVTLADSDPATGRADPSPVLFVQGARNPKTGIFALGLADPAAPTVLGSYTDSYGHDIWTGRINGDAAAACLPGHDPCDIVVNWAGDAIRILDWTDKARTFVAAEYRYPGLGYAHSGWISRDGRHLFSMDESDQKVFGGNSRVRVLDVSDWRNPRLVAQWNGSTAAIEHNGYTRGDKYYMSHYERGLTVLDVSDPEAPTEAAFFDTYPASDSPNYHGAWGVYPFLSSGTILISNIDGAGGLFILRESITSAAGPRVPLIPREPVLPLPSRGRPRRSGH